MTDLLIPIIVGIVCALGAGVLGFIIGHARGQNDAVRSATAYLASEKDTLAQRFENMEKAMQAQSAEATRNAIRDATQTLSRAVQDRIQESDRNRAEDRRELQGAIVQPVMDQVGRLLEATETARRGSAESSSQVMEAARKIGEQVSAVTTASATLSQALKGDRAERGRWGEMQLERLVELAGLNEKVDWTRQEGSEQRPDLVLHLPGGGGIPVDAKAPMDAFLRMIETEDPGEQARFSHEHSRALHDHVRTLGRKNYGGGMRGPGFTIMFLPLESLLAEAIRRGGAEVLQRAAEQRVVIATPHTLLGMLWGIAATWRESAMQENAEVIRKEAVELNSRFGVFWSKFLTIGRTLGKAVDAHNATIRSAEARLFPKLRRFRELQWLDPADAVEPELIEERPQLPELPDLTGAS